MEHGRFEFSPIIDRKPLRFPNGSRIAVWVIPNIEHFHFDQPSTSITPMTANLKPDVLNYSWRDYGVRVGIWRLMDVLTKYGVKGTVALNSEVCDFYPQIIRAGRELEWEWMAHGSTNSVLLNNQTYEEENKLIQEVITKIHSSTGTSPKGWLSPALSETHNTPDILAKNGIEYLCNWVNDEQPYAMRVQKGRLISMPYSVEINDIPAFLEFGMTPEEFCQMITDQFDVLYEDGANTGRVMSICLHPFLIGHPFRAKYLAKALEHISQRNEVWIAKGGDIANWFIKNCLE